MSSQNDGANMLRGLATEEVSVHHVLDTSLHSSVNVLMEQEQVALLPLSPPHMLNTNRVFLSKVKCRLIGDRYPVLL